MILECRKVHEETGISENDIAKRLMDYGYHAPTLSLPRSRHADDRTHGE